MPTIIFESFGNDKSIELDLTKASEKEIKEAFIKSIKQTKKETKKNDQINYFFKLFSNPTLAKFGYLKHDQNKIRDSGQSSPNLIKSNLTMENFNKDLAIEYINQMLNDQYKLIEDRKLDPDYIQDQELKESTELELAEIVNAEKFMDQI